MSRTNFYANLLLLVLCIGPGAAAVHAEARDESADLRVREQQLSKKVRVLRSEQQQLLLRKMLYSADSKYLELDLRTGEGSLRYRARILRTFRFTRQGRYPKPLPEGGIFVMAAKVDGAPAKRMLSFNDAALVVQGKLAGKGHGGCSGLCLTVGKRDLAAIYFALEAGSFAYMKAR